MSLPEIPMAFIMPVSRRSASSCVSSVNRMQSMEISSSTALTRRITSTISPSESAFIMRISGFVMAGPLAGSPASAYAAAKALTSASSRSRNSIRYSSLPALRSRS